MSIPPINPFAGMAAHQPTDDQRQIHNERERKQDQARLQSKTETDAEAASAAEAEDREGDGKQEWKIPHSADKKTESEPAQDAAEEHRSRSIDPACGNQLDLDG